MIEYIPTKVGLELEAVGENGNVYEGRKAKKERKNWGTFIWLFLKVLI